MKLSASCTRFIEETTLLVEQSELEVLGLRRVRPIENRIGSVNPRKARSEQNCDPADVSGAATYLGARLRSFV